MSTYIHFTDEQKKQARQTDLAAMLPAAEFPIMYCGRRSMTIRISVMCIYATTVTNPVRRRHTGSAGSYLKKEYNQKSSYRSERIGTRICYMKTPKP